MRIAMVCLCLSLLALTGCEMGAEGAVKKQSTDFGAAVSRGDHAAARAMMLDGLVFTDLAGTKHKGADAFVTTCKQVAEGRTFDLSVSTISQIGEGKYASICTVRADGQSWKLKLGWGKTESGWVLAAVNELSQRPGAYQEQAPVAAAPPRRSTAPAPAAPAAPAGEERANPNRGGDARMSTRGYIGDKVKDLQGGGLDD